IIGAAQGLGLSMAEGVAEAGGTVYCLDRQRECGSNFSNAQELIPRDSQGAMIYGQVDVQDTKALHRTIQDIADKHGQLNGCIAAAGINEVIPALEYTVSQSNHTMSINFDGVMQTATACAKQIYKHNTPNGSIVLIASMSGVVANRGLNCPVYNASKAAVTQLARNLAMEWGRKEEDGSGGIRVNCISPGNILTPRVVQHFVDQPHLRSQWEDGNMLGRVSRAEEFGGAGIFLLSKASSFMTGHNMLIDGGYTSW
ncbi:D-arabinitol 2-dehydrogenase, partial [Pseudovirgaria hyperparasitica]